MAATGELMAVAADDPPGSAGPARLPAALAMGVLLVEGNPADARQTEAALRQSGIAAKIHHVRDGVQGLAFLRREGVYRQAPKPELVILDLNLPRLHGRELLAQIKRDPNLRSIPAIVLTDGEDDDHPVRAADMPAEAIIAKPASPEQLIAALRAHAAHNSAARTGSAAAAPGASRLLADLAHQLRTHLNPILAFSEMMKLEIRGPLNGDYREYARGIHQSALALSHVVLEMLDRPKAEAPRPLLNEGRVALRQTIHAAIARVREQARIAEIKISPDLPAVLPELQADAELIAEMLAAVLDRAIKQVKRGAALHVGTGVTAAGGLFLSVRVNGVMRQAEGAAAAEPEGLGLGLSICRLVAELHGARLEATEWAEAHSLSLFFPLARTLRPAARSG